VKTSHCQNPCPCGYCGAGAHWARQPCSCTPTRVSKYQKRISGPILDRIDIYIEVPRVPIAKLASPDSGEPSTVIRGRVEAARGVQQARIAELGKPGVLVNGDMGPDEVQKFCALDDAGRHRCVGRDNQILG
jgi:magnesium chelatase family protein